MLCPGQAVPLPALRKQNLPCSAPQSALCPPSCWAVLLLESTEPVGQGWGWAELRWKRQEHALDALFLACSLLHGTHSFQLFTERETRIVLVPHWGISVFPSALALSSAFPALPVHQVQRFPQEQAGNKEVTEATESTIYSCPLCQEWMVKPCIAGSCPGLEGTSH